MVEDNTFVRKKEISTLIKNSPVKVTLSDGTVIDLDNGEDWGGKRLTRKEKLFIFWYTFPYTDDLSCYHCASKAAIRAGYSVKNSRQVGYIVLRNNKDLVAKIDAKYARTAIDEAAQKMVARKIQRATFDISDFYETVVDDNGRTLFSPKDISKIPEDKRQLIDNLENKNGFFMYQLPNRQKEINDIINIKNTLDGNMSQNNIINVNVLVEAIKERADESRKIIAQNEINANIAEGFMLNPPELIEEE